MEAYTDIAERIFAAYGFDTIPINEKTIAELENIAKELNIEGIKGV